jgi:MGT family glycosyltransferase
MHASRDANLYLFPAEADYTAARPLDATWHRMDSSVRETDEAYELPALASERPPGSALIYLSLGSLGSADVGLMRRLVDALAETPHRYIVSKGPLHAEYDLADNMVGSEFLPQTTLMPHVDAVVTHGGNNTVTEALHHGKPMIVLPLFWDQYDNAQRMDELGFGVRLPTYAFTDDELHAALGRVLGPELRSRLSAVGQAIRGRDGVRAGADVIERVARTGAARRG